MTKDCIFCKIIKGEIPCSKIYEDDKVFAFLDIMPVNPGHTLIVPKKHSENIFDIPEDDLKAVASVMKKVSVAVKKGTGCDGISIAQSNGEAAGQVVPHVHFHVMPRLKGDGLKLWPQRKYKDGELEETKKKIIKYI